jgi:hypothetical protein
MSLLLAGMTVLVLGDSHLATKGYLIDTLHGELMAQGAHVYSYGACGTQAGDWMKPVRPTCGSAFKLDDKPTRERRGEAASMTALPELVKLHHPNLIVVVNGDTMAGYNDKGDALPKPWIRGQVRALTEGIKASGASCVWVGPGWGNKGKFYKTVERTQEMSDFLADNVAPCIYINSLKMSKPGEWGIIPGDGQHFTDAGYQSWGSAIAREIVSSDIMQKIKH